jgi:ABC-2 type transport system ATP-binding protein
LKELEKIPSVNEVRKEGDKFRLYTHDPANVLSGLWEYAKTNDLKPISLTTLGPSLEDVFVRLTGIDVKTDKEAIQ